MAPIPGKGWGGGRVNNLCFNPESSGDQLNFDMQEEEAALIAAYTAKHTSGALRFCFADDSAAVYHYNAYAAQATRDGASALGPDEYLDELERLFGMSEVGRTKCGNGIRFDGPGWFGVLRRRDGTALDLRDLDSTSKHLLEVTQFGRLPSSGA